MGLEINGVGARLGFNVCSDFQFLANKSYGFNFINVLTKNELIFLLYTNDTECFVLNIIFYLNQIASHFQSLETISGHHFHILNSVCCGI